MEEHTEAMCILYAAGMSGKQASLTDPPSVSVIVTGADSYCGVNVCLFYMNYDKHCGCLVRRF